MKVLRAGKRAWHSAQVRTRTSLSQLLVAVSLVVVLLAGCSSYLLSPPSAPPGPEPVPTWPSSVSNRESPRPQPTLRTTNVTDEVVITERGGTLSMHVGQSFRLLWQVSEHYGALLMGRDAPDPKILQASRPPAPGNTPYPPSREINIRYTAIAPTTGYPGRTVIRADTGTCVDPNKPCAATLITFFEYVEVLP